MNQPLNKRQVADRLAVTISLQSQGMITTCVTCEHYDESSWTCKLFKQQPPPKIVASGCGEWSEGLPF